jgi:YesN/AraC family two-component response regulator
MRSWRLKGVRGRWLQSYAIVLMIPIMMMIATYLQTRNVIEEEIYRANSALLSQLQQEIDNNIDYTYRLADYISVHPQIMTLIRNQTQIGWSERLLMVEIMSDLRAYNAAGHSEDHLYIYFPDGDFVLSDKSYYPANMYFDLYEASSGITLDNWRNYLKQDHAGRFTSLKEFSGGIKEGIMFTRSMILQEQKTYPATIAIEMNQDRLMSAIRNIQNYNQGNVYILDAENRLLASSEAFLNGEISFGKLEGKNGTGMVTDSWNGKQVVLSYMESNKSNWKYVYVLPSRLYAQKAEYVRNMTVLTLGISLVLGSVIAVFLARKNYHPLERLVRNVAQRNRPELAKVSPSQLNEYDYLEEVIDNALDNNTLMHRTIEKQRKTIRSNLLVRILKGRLEQGFPLNEVLPEHGVRLTTQDLAVMLFYLEDYSGFFRQEEQDEEKKREFVQLIMTNIIEELAGQTHQGWMVEIDDMLACIVNFREGTSSAQAMQDLANLAEEAQRFIGNRFHIQFTVSVSMLHRSVAELPAAYQEAMEAMEYRMLQGIQTIIWYERIKQHELSYAYSMEKEQQLINYVTAGDFAGAKQTLDDIIDSNLGQGNISVDMIRCLMFDMCSTMMKAAMEANLNPSELYEENLEAIKELMNGSTAQAMRERMTLFLRKVCSHSEERKKSGKYRLKDKVLAYISGNYQDHDLSITTISRHFDVHPSYLSRYFKEQAGENLTEYINKYRVEQAKALLLQEEILIKDICDMVGMYNINTFIRLFKKYEGVTPSTYRESSRH